MLMATPQAPGRMSQLLPSVNCSTCQRPVPLAELGDHVCQPPPPLPKPALNLPKPSLSPNAATSLLPQRLQGRVGGGPPPSPGARSPLPPQNVDPPRSDRLGISTNAGSSPSFRSPLSGNGPNPRSNSRDPYSSGGESPIRNRPPMGGFARARSGSSASSTVPTPSTARPFAPSRDAPPAAKPPPPAERSLNTQIGGEAGMAGVGRRGFAAAARAAMFTAPPSTRPNPPRNLDIGAATSTASTPPLSTSSSDSPVAPFPESPVESQRYNTRSRSPPRTRAPPAQVKPAPSISSSRGGGPLSQSSGSEYGGLAYADSDDDDDEYDRDLRRANELRSGVVSFRPKDPPPPLPLSDSRRPSDSSSISRSNAPSTRTTSKSGSEKDYEGGAGLKRSNSSVIAQALGLSQTPPSAYGRLGGPGMTPSTRSGHSRGSSNGSAQSAYSSKSAVAIGDQTATPSGGPSGSGKGRLEREMDSLVDDVGRPALSKAKSTGRSFSPEASRVAADSRTGKLPARSRSPARSGAGKEEPKRARKPKVCLRCERPIEDGKWVQVDGGGVLCEKCWKNMYLPKCRRCNLPIEKQAVSSSDGQLKGKYHRECFNCHTCHKPFPDKTFYVLDSKPFCAYHYHEANDSLCAAARCGQPIEGPCAVSHTGDRYHPEHMLCEYPGKGGCKEKLAEYWEVDGRMLCERHASSSRLADEEADAEGDWKPSSRAMKRVTRFIDLTNGRG